MFHMKEDSLRVTQRKRQVKESKRDCSEQWRKANSWRRRWREKDVGYLEGEAQLRKTKRYCCLVTQGQAGVSLFFLYLTHTNTHWGQRGRLCGHQGLSSL